MDFLATRAGGQHHAFGNAEFHLARGQVGDIEGQATFQCARVRVGTLDAGEDVALGAAQIEGQAQQFVGTFNKFGLFDQGNAQVDGGKGVKVDFCGQRRLVQFTIARRGSGCIGGQVFPGSFDHGLDARRFDTGQQWLKRIQLMVGQQGLVIFPAERRHIEEVLGGGGQIWHHRLEQDDQLAEQVDTQRADGLHFCLLAVLFVECPGRLFGNPGIGAIGQRHGFAHGAGEVTFLIGVGNSRYSGKEGCSQFRCRVGVDHDTLVAFVDKAGTATGDIDDLADQVGVDLLHKVLKVEVEVLDAAAQLAGIVVTQVFRVQVFQVGACLDEGAAGLGHFLPVNGQVTMHIDAGRLAKACAMQHGRPEQGVEVDDVLADEMVQFSPGVGSPEGVKVEFRAACAQVLEAGHVADRGVEPDVEVLAGFAGNLEAEVGGITADVPFLQFVVQPFVNLVGHGLLQGTTAGPLFQHGLKFRQLEEEVPGVLEHRGGAGDGRARIFQLGRLVGGTTFFAVVAVLVLGTTLGASALDEAVGQEHALVRVKILGDRTRGDMPGFFQSTIDKLGKILIFFRMC